MEIKTIVIPELQKKAFEVHTSIRNMKRMFAYQLAVAKVSDGLEEDDVVGQISASLKGLDVLLPDTVTPCLSPTSLVLPTAICHPTAF